MNNEHILAHRRRINQQIFGSYNLSQQNEGALQKSEDKQPADDHETEGFQKLEDEGLVNDHDADNEEKAMDTGNTPGKETVEKGEAEEMAVSDEAVEKGGPGSGRHKEGDHVLDHGIKVGDHVRDFYGETNKVVEVRGNNIHFGNNKWAHASKVHKIKKGIEYVPDGNMIHAHRKNQIFKSYSNGDELVKAGEGSRGGKVIGHTKSGKPIYAGGTKGTTDSHYKNHSKEDFDDSINTHKEHLKVAISEHEKIKDQFHPNSSKYKESAAKIAHHNSKIAHLTVLKQKYHE